MPARDRCECVVRIAASDCVAQLVEVPDHRGGKVEVQLAAGNGADPEAVPHSRGNEDERPLRTGDLLIVQEHDVLALEHVERLGRIVVDVQRWAEAGWLLSLEQQNSSPVSSPVALTVIANGPRSIG